MQPPPAQTAGRSGASQALDQSQFDALAKASRRGPRRRNARDIDVGDLSSSDEDDYYDLHKQLTNHSFPHFDRCEHLPIPRMASLAKLYHRSCDRNLPFLAPSSLDLMKHWTPAHSLSFGPDRNLSDTLNRRKTFNSVEHFIRHRLTWGFMHISLGAFDHASFFLYLAELIEIGDAYGLIFLLKYDRLKIGQILEHISLRADRQHLGENKFATPADASKWLSEQLRLCDPQLLQSARLAHLMPLLQNPPPGRKRSRSPRKRSRSPRKENPRDKGDKPKGKGRGGKASDRGRRSRTRSPSKRRKAPPKSKHICFAHDPSSGLVCSCSFDHLDTKEPGLLLRFTAAKTSYERRKSE